MPTESNPVPGSANPGASTTTAHKTPAPSSA
ncbi:MAG: hypothetical protein QOJ18_1225, partial [Microbacteriaceae bacterium]|nr:hypothetical protein [Microbacteriaceae bacterium]